MLAQAATAVATSTPPSSATRAADAAAPTPSTAQGPSTATPPTTSNNGPVLSFDARLAHGSDTRTVGGFGSVKGLYEALGRTFGLPPGSIMYCTVNTPRADMSKLLGSALEEGDVIFAHVRGGTKSVTVPSWGPIGTVLGDNGAGAVYIRRIKEESVLRELAAANPNAAAAQEGDVFKSINGVDVPAGRHGDLARALAAIPLGVSVTLELVSALRASTDEYVTVGSDVGDASALHRRESTDSAASSNKTPPPKAAPAEPKSRLPKIPVVDDLRVDDAAAALQRWLEAAKTAQAAAGKELEEHRRSVNAKCDKEVRKCTEQRDQAIASAQAEFNRKLAMANAEHEARVSAAVARRDKQVAESEVAIAFAEDLQRIDTVATQLMEMERRASSVRDRPLDHFCTISHEVMTDPVLTMCGHTFERTEVARWFETQSTCPYCGQNLVDKKMLIPNFAVRNMINEWESTYRVQKK